MRQAVQKGCCHAFALEDLPPVAERKIARQQQTSAFVTISKNLKQQLRTAATEGQVPQFIHDQQIGAIQLRQITIKQIRLLLFFEQIHQSRSCEESHRVALTTRSGSQ